MGFPQGTGPCCKATRRKRHHAAARTSQNRSRNSFLHIKSIYTLKSTWGYGQGQPWTSTAFKAKIKFSSSTVRRRPLCRGPPHTSAALGHLLPALFEVDTLSLLPEESAKAASSAGRDLRSPRPRSKFLEIILSSLWGPGRWEEERMATRPSLRATKKPFRIPAKAKHR